VSDGTSYVGSRLGIALRWDAVITSNVIRIIIFGHDIKKRIRW